jgi:tRNA(Ile)-lysidine synthetase-like protein
MRLFLLSLTRPEGSSSFNLHSKKGSLQFKLFISSDVLNLVDANSINELPQGFQENWNLKDIIKIPTGVLSSQKLIGKKPFGRHKSQKIKNLFQEFKIPDWKRDFIPLIYIDDRIAAVGDLWVCEEFHTSPDERGMSIIWNQNQN